MTTVEAHSCLLNMHVTFDLTEIEEVMTQQARKQLDTELGTSVVALVVFTVCIQQFWSVQSSPESRFYKSIVLSHGYLNDAYITT